MFSKCIPLATGPEIRRKHCFCFIHAYCGFPLVASWHHCCSNNSWSVVNVKNKYSHCLYRLAENDHSSLVHQLLYLLTSNCFCCIMSLQKSKSLNFPTKTVLPEMPSTDALMYLMFKTTRGALVDLKESLNETILREFNKISDKGMSPLQLLITIFFKH